MFPGASFSKQGLGFILGAIIFFSLHYSLSSSLLIPSANINSLPNMGPICPCISLLESSLITASVMLASAPPVASLLALLIAFLFFSWSRDQSNPSNMHIWSNPSLLTVLEGVPSLAPCYSLQDLESSAVLFSSASLPGLPHHCISETLVSILFLWALFLPFTS